ncbi:5704_t:CDS:2 [Cetraspora pellucida]|uniref:5704_t:CDS:1 n=1 Tax=Cetraspora pellucida TaxID=1433469 RepID=A0A9N9I7J2_9GLOM|nr:5704_t:CDS:2 [Cetraspora pellucida]
MPEVTTLEEQTSNSQTITVEPTALNNMTPNPSATQTNEQNQNSEQNIPQHLRKTRGGGGVLSLKEN